MRPEKQLENTALALGADAAATARVRDITFEPAFREMCEMNSCGKYGTCWMCPPDVGPVDAMIQNAQSYPKALVFQTVGQLEDSFDIDGMQAAAKRHNTLTRQVAEQLVPRLTRSLVMGAGGCQVCERCAKTEEKPCRFPQLATSSLEAHGIAVSDLAAQCGLAYINGPNTVTYFSAVFYDEEEEAAHAQA